jgi:Ca-activated chloride channel family protein
MSLGAPVALVALIAVPAVLAAARLLARYRSQGPVAYTNLTVLEAALGSRRRGRRLAPALLLLLALVAAATAAAHPRARLPVRVSGRLFQSTSSNICAVVTAQTEP